VIHPELFTTRPCPGYEGIDLAVRPAKPLAALLEGASFDAIHLATEGPLGWAARGYCLRKGLPFTTAFHTRFPEMLKAALHIPLWIGYAIFRHFHRKSSGVMVPTAGVMQLLDQKKFCNLRPWTHGVDIDLFPYSDQPQQSALLGELPRPVSLFVGRLSAEKNIQAFLDLDIPGTKVVCGVGPLGQSLHARYPDAVWLGVLPREQLASVYRAADVFVMCSKTETFGLVALEAMASGTPVAAFPVDGPQEVLGSPAQGGALHTDLSLAWHQALQVPRENARARALDFSWEKAASQFLSHLVPVVTKMSSKK
jgi:glycosyltransferase involved in cell wall biosynthesis